jgi:hypothetical protein
MNELININTITKDKIGDLFNNTTKTKKKLI